MIEMIKEIGIFIVIAQSVLYFVPGQTYAKYVKVIIGIIMIAGMMQPLLNLITGEEWENMVEQAAALYEGEKTDTEEFFAENSRNTILLGIEEELKNRLASAPLKGYEVRKVSVKTDETGEVEKLVITVSGTEERPPIRVEEIVTGEAEDSEENIPFNEESRLKEYYGELLAVPSRRIEICRER